MNSGGCLLGCKIKERLMMPCAGGYKLTTAVTRRKRCRLEILLVSTTAIIKYIIHLYLS